MFASVPEGRPELRELVLRIILRGGRRRPEVERTGGRRAHRSARTHSWRSRVCVVHEGVGSVDLMLMAVNNGKDRMVFAGPVLSHYEFEMPGVTRKSIGMET